MGRAQFTATVVGVAVLGAFVSYWKLGTDVLTEDEVTYARAGTAYLHGNTSPNPEHPPLAKLLIGVSRALFGSGPVGMRFLGATLGLLTAAVIFVWLSRNLGRVPALFGAGLWILSPHPVIGAVRGDRLALLEPYVTFFALVTIATAWEFHRTQQNRWLLLSGAAGGLALASKFTALPALVIAAGVIAKEVRARPRRTRALSVVAPVMSVAILGALYLVTFRSHTLVTIRQMLDQQSALRDSGRVSLIAGHRYLHPPWWANLDTQTRALGIGLTILMTALSLAAFTRRQYRGLAGLLAAVVAADLIFMVVVVRIHLVHYYLLWQPELAALAAVGAASLLAVTDRPRRWAGVAAIATAAVLCAPTIARAATLKPTGLEVVAHRVHDLCDADNTCAIDNPRGASVLETYLKHRVAIAVGSVPPGALVVVFDGALPTTTPGLQYLRATVRATGHLLFQYGRYQAWEVPTPPS